MIPNPSDALREALDRYIVTHALEPPPDVTVPASSPPPTPHQPDPILTAKIEEFIASHPPRRDTPGAP